MALCLITGLKITKHILKLTNTPKKCFTVHLRSPTFHSVGYILVEIGEANHPGSSSIPGLGQSLNIGSSVADPHLLLCVSGSRI